MKTNKPRYVGDHEREIQQIIRHDKANSIIRFSALVMFILIAIGYGAIVVLNSQF